jgi:hypothetical protein
VRSPQECPSNRSAASLHPGRGSSAASHRSTAGSITGPPASVLCAWRCEPTCVDLPLHHRGTRIRNRESQLARARGENRTASSRTTRAESTRPAHVAPGCSASWSRSVEGDVDEIWTRLAMLEAVGNNSKSQRLHLGLSLRRGSTVSQYTGQFRHFGQPPPVLLALDLNPEPHGLFYPRRAVGPSNTEISSEDRAIPALAGFVCFISLFCGVPRVFPPGTPSNAFASRQPSRIPDWRDLETSRAYPASS